MGKKARSDAIASWEKEKVQRAKIRVEHGGMPLEITVDQIQKYNRTMVEMLEKYEDKTPPAMPCEGTETSSESRDSLIADGEALNAEFSGAGTQKEAARGKARANRRYER